MPSIIVPLEEEVIERIERFPWVNWSEVAREEANKKRILEEFIKFKRLSKEDEEFCEKIDWNPVDELPLKPEFMRELKRIERGPHIKMTLKELNKLMGLR